MPVPVSWRGAWARPPSTTTRTPSTVSDVSAMSVASTTRRRPGGDGARARSCSSAGRAPASRRTSTPAGTDAVRRSAVRVISAMPGRNTSTSPGASRRATSTALAAARSRRSVRWRGRQRISTGWSRPTLASTGAGAPSTASSRAKTVVSAVADIASTRRSGRSVAAASSARARPRSVVRFRSCTSSNRMAATPGSSGSCWSRRVSTPSVSTSTRVAGPTRRSSRVWYPTRPPTAPPVSWAIRRAAARVARRRGSSTTIRPSPRQGSSSRASGTSVVLPAPGGALITARVPVRSTSRSAAITASMSGRSTSSVVFPDTDGR